MGANQPVKTEIAKAPNGIRIFEVRALKRSKRSLPISRRPWPLPVIDNTHRILSAIITRETMTAL